MADVATYTREYAAKQLGVAPAKIPHMILNGTLPVGTVYVEGKNTRSVIVAARWDRWIEGRDLEKR